MDLFPIFALDHKGNQLLKEFRLEGVTQAERDWCKEYKEKEASSGPELYENHKFKLYFVTNEDYNRYIQNAVVCKGLTGRNA